MINSELIDFGNKLKAKGRTPSEIYAALSNKAYDKNQLQEVLNKVFTPDKNMAKRSPDKVNALLKANKLKLNFEYSLKALNRISILILIVGLVTLFLSNEKVNQNSIFGITTIIQGILIGILYAFIKIKSRFNLLIIAVFTYFTLWTLELIIWGIPNDLLKVYNQYNMNIPSKFSIQAKAGVARIIGFIFPFLYLIIKVLLGWFVYKSYRNYTKYEVLPQEIKEEIFQL